MKRILPFIFAANTITATATAGPLLLTDRQMESITAGSVALDVNALAISLGPRGQTYTDTGASTHSFHTANGWQVDIGAGHGTAIACCGGYNASVVDVNAAVSGDRVFIREEHAESRSPVHSASRGSIMAVAITAPSGQKGELNRIDLSGLSLRVMTR